MDVQLIEKIVHEVKSQGVFDEFRKHSMADVDTKPAYQNLRQRVESSVKKFLEEQKWTPETNKNQLREKLRRHITDSGFLDVGVERIVDQVVNPKIGSVFRPRIEEIVYKYLGVTPPPKTQPPPPPLIHPLPPLPMSSGQLNVDTTNLLPHDLEQISPDSDKITVKSEDKNSVSNMEIDDDDDDDGDDQLEDDESPPYEPLVKENKDNENREEIPNKRDADVEQIDGKCIKNEESDVLAEPSSFACDTQDSLPSPKDTKLVYDDKDISHSFDKKLIPQESQLSSVSTDSLTENGKVCPLAHHSQEEVRTANISEEAQMPKFNENSNEINANVKDSVEQTQLHFDIKKDEIKFIGTERKLSLAEEKSPVEDRKELKDAISVAEQYTDEDSTAFKFSMSSNKRIQDQDAQDVFPCASNTQKSFASLSEDTAASIAAKGKETSVECISSPRSIKDNSLITPISISSTNITTPTSTPTASPNTVPVVTHQQQKEGDKLNCKHSTTTSSTTSSYKYKHHSKEHRHSAGEGREHRHRSKQSKDKDEHRARGSHRHHSSSSSRSKHSSTSTYKHHKSSSKKDSDSERTKKHSRNGDDDRKRHHHHHHSSSHNHSRNSQKGGYSSSSSTPNTSTKSDERKDDHNEAKENLRRRKSNDSNDENDNYMNPANPLGPSGVSTIATTTTTTSSSSSPSNSKSTIEEKSPSSPTSAKHGLDEIRSLPNNNNNTYHNNNNNNNNIITDNTNSHHIKNNVVIINDILENPDTNFIKFHHSEQQASVQIIVSSNTGKEADITNTDAIAPFKENMQEGATEKIESDLLYFDDKKDPDCERFLKMLDDLVEMCRFTKQFLQIDRDDLTSPDAQSNVTQSNSTNEDVDEKKWNRLPSDDEKPQKRLKLHDENSVLQESPQSDIPKDSIANNLIKKEVIESDKLKKTNLDTRLKAMEKLTQQQRYNSEDLYKPRPIFGQRSRRRCLNTLL